MAVNQIVFYCLMLIIMSFGLLIVFAEPIADFFEGFRTNKNPRK